MRGGKRACYTDKTMNIEDKIQKDIALKPFTTWKVGGPAKYYLEVKAKEELSVDPISIVVDSLSTSSTFPV